MSFQICMTYTTDKSLTIYLMKKYSKNSNIAKY